ncbi:hypothetical protein TIFTF001_046848 [Ficus carica]|uniref:Uncharacterized protein n=1 Tax=Ficus carica TaxID=3494 RepID=A0AA87Z6M3_FICCA|nr:hypothetical protein TIFTF001_046848 [Ficus carica]
MLATLLAGGLGLGAHRLATLSGETGEPVLIAVFVFIIAAAVTFLRFLPQMKARYDYGLLVFILTFCLVSVSGYRDDEVIRMALERLTTIMIGSFTTVIICIFICPVWIGVELHKGVAGNLEKLGNFLEGRLWEEEKGRRKNLGVAGFCALEWPDSRARVVKRNLEPNKPRRPVLVVTRGEEKNQRSLAKPLIPIEFMIEYVADNIVVLAERKLTYYVYAVGFADEYFQLSEAEDSSRDKSFLEGYKSVLTSKNNEENMANLARWELRHGPFIYRHPWKQYLKVANLARQCAYKIEALYGYLKSETQV